MSFEVPYYPMPSAGATNLPQKTSVDGAAFHLALPAQAPAHPPYSKSHDLPSAICPMCPIDPRDPEHFQFLALE